MLPSPRCPADLCGCGRLQRGTPSVKRGTRAERAVNPSAQLPRVPLRAEAGALLRACAPWRGSAAMSSPSSSRTSETPRSPRASPAGCSTPSPRRARWEAATCRSGSASASPCPRPAPSAPPTCSVTPTRRPGRRASRRSSSGRSSMPPAARSGRVPVRLAHARRAPHAPAQRRGRRPARGGAAGRSRPGALARPIVGIARR